MQGEKRKIRVLVVDDSAVIRKLVTSLLERDGDIEVVGTAIDGDFAIGKVEQLKPDVVTLDVDMPRMDGMTALSQIVSRNKVPVIMLSSLTARGAELTMQALEKGAVDFVCKPKGSGYVGEMADDLISKIKGAVRTRTLVMSGGNASRQVAKKALSRLGSGPGAERIVAVGASSGGPHALRYMLPKLPAGFDAGIVVVQHLPETFTGMLARWLDEICEMEVKEAVEGEMVGRGKILIAPANAHIRVRRTIMGAEVAIYEGEPVNGHIPSVDVLFKSVAKEFGRDAVGVLMTGMGSDGALGLGEIKKAGGHTVAQSRESCSVYGMPRVAQEKGFVERIVSLECMAAYLSERIGTGVEGGNHAGS